MAYAISGVNGLLEEILATVAESMGQNSDMVREEILRLSARVAAALGPGNVGLAEAQAGEPAGEQDHRNEEVNSEG